MSPFNKRLVTLLLPMVLASASSMAMAQEKILISVQKDPATKEGLEPACVVLQLGKQLLDNGAEVKIFSTLDGVFIADAETYGYKPKKPEKPAKTSAPECDTLTPGVGLGTASLEDLLIDFLDAGGEILLCPLCDAVRQPYTPITDFIGYAESIYSASPIPDLLDADKVIDY